MDPETELLFKVIGRDKPLGSHSQTDELSEFVESIKTGRDPYRLFGKASREKDLYRRSIIELAPSYNSLSEPAFDRLVSVVVGLDLYKDREVGRAPIQKRALSCYESEQVGKRASWLRAFAGLEPPLYTVENLLRETEFRDRHHWKWVDTVRPQDPDVAYAEIIERWDPTERKHDQDDDVRMLAFRAPNYYVEVPDGRQSVEHVLRSVRDKTSEERFAIITDTLERRGCEITL